MGSSEICVSRAVLLANWRLKLKLKLNVILIACKGLYVCDAIVICYSHVRSSYFRNQWRLDVLRRYKFQARTDVIHHVECLDLLPNLISQCSWKRPGRHTILNDP